MFGQKCPLLVESSHPASRRLEKIIVFVVVLALSLGYSKKTMSVDLLVFHRTPVVSDTTPVAMALLQPGGIRGVSLPLTLVSRELRYFDLVLNSGKPCSFIAFG